MIRFDHVEKRFPDGTVAVRDLTLGIQSGEFCVFVGPSGCGKTTSMRMVNRMLDPTSGSVTIDGVDTRDLDKVTLRRSIGYVIQSAGLLPHRTVVDNVATVPLLNGVRRSVARAHALDLLEQVGLDATYAKRYPQQLSGGEQQRVGVARALASDPAILLMDEPFSAVDPVVRAGLQDQIQALQRQLGKTIVFVTHDIDEAVRLGDRIAVFGRGAAVEQFATPQEVLARPATEFVDSLVGRDRGYRSLEFAVLEDAAIDDAPAVGDAELGHLELGEGEWSIVVDRDWRAVGWIDGRGLASWRAGAELRAVLVPVGRPLTRAASLRRALDAALSSVSGLAVVTGADGAVAGVVSAPSALGLVPRPRPRHTTAAGTHDRSAS